MPCILFQLINKDNIKRRYLSRQEKDQHDIRLKKLLQHHQSQSKSSSSPSSKVEEKEKRRNIGVNMVHHISHAH